MSGKPQVKKPVWATEYTMSPTTGQPIPSQEIMDRVIEEELSDNDRRIIKAIVYGLSTGGYDRGAKLRNLGEKSVKEMLFALGKYLSDMEKKHVDDEQ